ncbi:trypsin-like serine protease, partial [Xenorhabdus innexi]
MADFAIIKLNKPINSYGFGHIRRFFYYDNAYEKNEKYYKDYYNASIYGYGSLGIDERTGEIIPGTGEQKRADVKIITAAKDLKGNDGLITKENEALTAGVSQSGDSGGPVIWNNTIIGVISLGEDALSEKDTGSERPLAFSVISDVTGKYLTTKFYQPKDLGHWFSETMEKIWIDSPDWNGRVSKRGENIIVRGYARPNSKIKLSYSIDSNLAESIECNNPVDSVGGWECNIPYKSYHKYVVDEVKQYNINITVRESEQSDNSWREDTVTAEIPSIEQELLIVYPLDKSIVHTNNFTIRGHAAPNSNIKLKLESNKNKELWQDELCAGINKNESIKANESGLWTCAIKTDVIISELGSEFVIEAEQKNREDEREIRSENLLDKVNITLQPENYTDLALDLKMDDGISIYRKMFDLNATYDKNANFICTFHSSQFQCTNKPDYFHFDIPNDAVNMEPTQIKERDFPIGALQLIDGQDQFDSKQWYDITFKNKSAYFQPQFEEEYDIKSPMKIQSTEIKDKIFSGFGGDKKNYSRQYDNSYLPSEYSICMKKNSHSPSGSPKCNRNEDRDIYVRIPLKENTYFSEIPIQYSDYNGIHN